MLYLCKPKTIVEVCHLKKELNLIVLWPTHDNNVCLFMTRLMTLLQEIHAKTGRYSYTGQRFITKPFSLFPLLISSKALGSWRIYLSLLTSFRSWTRCSG
jgi:hypothetical protein